MGGCFVSIQSAKREATYVTIVQIGTRKRVFREHMNKCMYLKKGQTVALVDKTMKNPVL